MLKQIGRFFYKPQLKFFSPRIQSGSIFTTLDEAELEHLRELYSDLKEDVPVNRAKEIKELEDDKNLIIINTENTEFNIDKKITVNEIDWEKSNLKEYKIVFNESMVNEGERDLGYITFDEDGKSQVPSYQEYQDEQKSKRKNRIDNLESEIIIDESKKPEITVATTKSYFVFPEQKDFALRYYEILTTKGRVSQKDLQELEKIKPKYLSKYNSKPGSFYVYKNYTEALEEVRLLTEIKPELKDSEIKLKVVINIDPERPDHDICTEILGVDMKLNRENVISLGSLQLSDDEIKKTVKKILDSVYAVRPKSVIGSYFLSSALLVDNKEFYVDVMRSAKSRNK
jgi:hypothetical protein